MRDYCVLGELSKVVGWVYSDTVNKLEDERKKQSKMFYNLKCKRNHLMCTARKNVLANNSEIKKVNDQLAKLGY